MKDTTESFQNEEFAKGKYEERLKEIQNSIEGTINKLRKRFIVSFVLCIVMVSIFLFGFFSSKKLLMSFSAIFFIIIFLVIIDVFKRRGKAQDLYQLRVNKMSYYLENENIFITPPVEDKEKYLFLSKKMKICLTSVLCVFFALFIAGGVFYNWLFPFSPEKWQNNPWQRKFMIKDLQKQQDIYVWNDFTCPYNFRFMTKEEINDLLYVKDSDGIAVDVTIEYGPVSVNTAPESLLYYAYTDEDGINYWILVRYSPYNMEYQFSSIMKTGGYEYSFSDKDYAYWEENNMEIPEIAKYE